MNFYVACVSAAVLSFLISFAGGFVLIPFLRKLKFGQTILEIGPKWHEKKQGTPTMGGILFIISTVFSFIFVAVFDKIRGGSIVSGNEITGVISRTKLISGFAAAGCFSFIGFIDDYIKVVKKQNLGLKISQKTVLQTVLSVAYLLTLFINDSTGSMFVPFFGMVETKVFFWLLGIPVIYCTVNAVNFTDGVDGLCGSVTFTASVSFTAVAVLRKASGVGLLGSALSGGLLGYLIWNRYPARVMMGDTGSMFLGGMIICFSYCLDMPYIILLIGIVYVLEFLSDIIQIVYFKLSHGKRIFKMAPFHHHLELCGWSENKIVRVFTLVGLAGGLTAFLLVYFGNLR